jgi:hypothetical protein
LFRLPLSDKPVSDVGRTLSIAGCFSFCRPPSFHQLGKPLPFSRGDSTLFFGRGRSTHLLAGLQSCPTSSGGRAIFALAHTRKNAKFPVSGPRTTTTGVADCIYDEAGNVIETHEHAGDFKEW